jgi:hypothetical protein
MLQVLVVDDEGPAWPLTSLEALQEVLTSGARVWADLDTAADASSA